MLHVIKNVVLYAPEYIGLRDIIVGGGEILEISTPNSTYSDVFTVTDGEENILVPGFVDGLVHIVGGGGEGGFGNRTIEITAKEMLSAGITCAAGALGTDSITRSVENLLGKSRELTEQGVCTYFYTGSYHLPPCTITGCIERDILYLSDAIGLGELALSDHRGSVVSFNDLYCIGRRVRTSASLAGKTGVVLCHLGDGEEQLSLLSEVVENTDLPKSLFWPTHINRNPTLFDAGIQYALDGGFVDFTTSTNAGLLADGEVSCAKALYSMLEAGVSIEQISFTSDANASLPRFDQDGNVIGTDSGKIDSLFQAVIDAVNRYDIPLELALRCITSNPAARLGLSNKGRIEQARDADFVMLNPTDFSIQQVWTNGIARLA
ncbi:beta-aspartyl-peptidase [Vibrio maritimus]|nr:beta-aspartyl-peptidase [Vibrio maritimus]